MIHDGTPRAIAAESRPIVGQAEATRNARRFDGLPNGANGVAPSRPVLSYLYGTELEGRALSRPNAAYFRRGVLAYGVHSR